MLFNIFSLWSFFWQIICNLVEVWNNFSDCIKYACEYKAEGNCNPNDDDAEVGNKEMRNVSDKDNVEQPVEQEICDWTQTEQNEVSPFISLGVQAKNQVCQDNTAAINCHTSNPKTDISSVILIDAHWVQSVETGHVDDKSMEQSVDNVSEKKFVRKAFLLYSDFI